MHDPGTSWNARATTSTRKLCRYLIGLTAISGCGAGVDDTEDVQETKLNFEAAEHTSQDHVEAEQIDPESIAVCTESLVDPERLVICVSLGYIDAISREVASAVAELGELARQQGAPSLLGCFGSGEQRGLTFVDSIDRLLLQAPMGASSAAPIDSGASRYGIFALPSPSRLGETVTDACSLPGQGLLSPEQGKARAVSGAVAVFMNSYLDNAATCTGGDLDQSMMDGGSGGDASQSTGSDAGAGSGTSSSATGSGGTNSGGTGSGGTSAGGTDGTGSGGTSAGGSGANPGTGSGGDTGGTGTGGAQTDDINKKIQESLRVEFATTNNPLSRLNGASPDALSPPDIYPAVSFGANDTIIVTINGNFDCLDELSCDDSCYYSAATVALVEAVLAMEYDGCNADVMPAPAGGDTCYGVLRDPDDEGAVAAVLQQACEAQQGVMQPPDAEGSSSCRRGTSTVLDADSGSICDDPAALCTEQGMSEPVHPDTAQELRPDPGPLPIDGGQTLGSQITAPGSPASTPSTLAPTNATVEFADSPSVNIETTLEAPESSYGILGSGGLGGMGMTQSATD